MAVTSQQVVTQFSDSECRAVRLVQMRDMFLDGGLYTIGELAARYGVSRFTIRRDLDSISRALNVPLVCETRWGLMRK